MAKQIIKDLSNGKVMPLLLNFAIPIMLSNLLQTAYNMVDMIIIGQYEGSVGLSAVSIGGDIMHFFAFAGMGFATAGQIIVSQYVGAGKKEELNKVIGTLLTFIVIVAIFLTFIGLIFAPKMLSWLNVHKLSYKDTYSYLICSCVGMIFIFGYNMVSAILRGMGDSRRPMYFIGFAAILNTILDILFIGSFNMGAFGAALATVIGQGASCILAFVYLYLNREAFGFDFKRKSFKPDGAIIKIIVRLGIPIAIQSSAGNISALFVSSYVNTYGIVATAVTGVGNKLNNVALIVANAMNVSGAAMIGQCFGANKMERIKDVFYHVFFVVLCFVSMLSIIMLLFPQQIFDIFNHEEQVLSMAFAYAPVAAISFMGFTFRSPCLSLINGLGQSKMNFMMGVFEGLILRIGLTYIMGVILDMGIAGFWYGSAIASYGYGLVVFPYFFSGKWRHIKQTIVVN